MNADLTPIPRDVLHRRDDPDTSVIAAKRAREFLADHEAIICGALFIPGTAHDVARRTGLQMEQVDRRVGKLIADGRIKVLPQTGLSPSGRPCRTYLQCTLDEQSAAKLLQPELFA